MAQRYVAIAQPSTGDEEWEALREPLQSGWLTQGPVVRRFEEAFARRHDVPHALATTSCTTALHLALAALGIGPGDEVIVPAFTWIATANAVVYCGATPVFVDVDPDTYNIDPALTAAAVTPRTRAVVPVHLFGLCAEMAAIREAVGGSVAVVEDAACAAGASYRGRPAGGLGDVACFSFHPRKSITTGEGGMLVTADAELAERAEQLRNHGASVPEEVRHHGPAPFLLPDFDELGFNYRMTDLQAAVGLVQLSKLDGFIDERAQWAKWYAEELASFEWLRVPAEPEGGNHAWQAYVTVVDGRCSDRAQRPHGAAARARCGHAPRDALGADHGLLPAAIRHRDGWLPGRGVRLQERSMAIPLHNRMTRDDYEHVVAAIRAAVGAR